MKDRPILFGNPLRSVYPLAGLGIILPHVL
jgi:hypothetical protein